MSTTDYGALSMLELFKLEAETQTQILTEALLALEHDPSAPRLLESCMRASHSLKGAARIVGLNVGVSVTHAMEDCFVAAQQGQITFSKPLIDLLLRGVDLITKVATANETELVAWSERNPPSVDAFVGDIQHWLTRPVAPAPPGPGRASAGPPTPPSSATTAMIDAPATDAAASDAAPVDPAASDPAASDAAAASSPSSERGAQVGSAETGDRAFRVSAHNFNRLVGLAAESLVESRWLAPFGGALLRLKRQQSECARTLDVLRDALPQTGLDELAARALTDAREKWRECQSVLAERLAELDAHERRVTALAHRMYEEALTCRMRPFSDAMVAFPRLVRDLAQSLGKRARLEMHGESTPVDRDVLALLEAPLNHLLRNALDHGIDPPEARLAAGKSETGVLRVEARHLAGMLEIGISDDGQGIDLERVRSAIVARGLIDPHTARQLGESEIYEFLFLPGFSLREEVTELSGRGVGLDVVQSTLKRLRGSVRVSSRLGQGTTFQLCLPLTVSVVQTLIADVGGQPYAFPLAQVDRTLSIAPEEIRTLEGRQHFAHAGRQIGLISAHQVLGVDERKASAERLPVIVVSDQEQSYGLVVERLRGARELVVQQLDPRLGKIKDIAAGALLEDGSPVLIADMDDLVRSVEKLVSGGQLSKIGRRELAGRAARKRVLVVDDSFTVRELERKLIDSGGYHVEVAVDGMDGWNAVRSGAFDLVVTDIDMPRMDGIDLVKLIRKDARLRTLPVMIVSYKDREQDRERGLEAGADHYLTKSSFKNEGLLQAVFDLIGEATAPEGQGEGAGRRASP